ncbi:hypothetical protein EMPS_01742 [Entomortierella parvispora]|uniref:Uncharacterized protein n=1 Tax=Entomortierella parvispora TaxID=205924 RepID=A0A9P3H3E4_9FUNG|nr:hypothetical protein EMPS_01742 [Entomortierella parvispora]
MILALLQLKRLWYLIVFVSVILLIADITLSTLPSYDGHYSLIPFSLFPEIFSILIFVYSLFGRANPLLIASSSKPWKRRLRLFGNLLLIALWMMNAIVGSKSPYTSKRIFAALDCFQIVLVTVELIISRRLGQQQRQLLKQQDRREKRVENDSTLDFDASEDEEGRTTLEPAIELVRPDAVDPEVVVYSQQLLFEMHQRQLQQEYQRYLDQQHRAPGDEGSDTEQAGIEVQNQSESGNKVDEETDKEGKVEDIFQESSYKIEESADLLPNEPASSTRIHVASAPPISIVDAIVDSQESDLTTLERNPQLHLEHNPLPNTPHETSM